MWQTILVTIIVAAAFGIAGYKIFLRFFSKKKYEDACGGCSGCTLKNDLKERQKACFEQPDHKKKWIKNNTEHAKGIADSK